MTAGRKLVLGGLVLAGATLYMAYLGASANWQYYLTADECVAGGQGLVGSRVRVSGRVAPGSLQIAPDRRLATFALHGAQEQLDVRCRGPLPDNLAENIDVVVEGRLEQSGRLQGEKVLTRCASKYESAKSSDDATAAPQTPAEAGP